MRTRRLIVLGVSLIVGAVMTWLIIYVGFASDAQEFAYSNVVLLFLSLSSVLAIWLDYFLGTQFLKS